MTAVETPREPVRFELAPVAGGRARWEWSIPLDLTPRPLSVPVIVAAGADVLVVSD